VIVKYDRSFEKDISKIKETKILELIYNLISEIKAQNILNDISNVKKLKANKNVYQIKLGKYRLGFYFEDNSIILVRFLHRKKIYTRFP
jgi:mRNA interferase RelE/StbE